MVSDDSHDLVFRSRSSGGVNYCLHVSLLADVNTVKKVITFMMFVELVFYRSENLETVGRSLDALMCKFVTVLRQMCGAWDPPYSY